MANNLKKSPTKNTTPQQINSPNIIPSTNLKKSGLTNINNINVTAQNNIP